VEPPRLDQVNIVTRDMAAAVAFYRSLGLAIPDAHPRWDDDHRSADTTSGLDVDIDSDTFAAKWNAGSKASVVVGFKVASREEVDRLYAEVTAAGYAGQQPPYDAFWGARYAIVEDPDGNGAGLMSPLDPDKRVPWPDPPA
jgi:catechol 2,3-dioxygenase-like lactoylglutathione lyase family enzyme